MPETAFSKAVKRAVSAFKGALFPEDITCDLCGAELIDRTRVRLCAECCEKMPLIKEHICRVCGVEISDESDYCLRCQNVESYFKVNRSSLLYEGEAQRLIHEMKFGKKKYIAHTLGAIMSDTYLKYSMSADVIVPVPMTDAEVKCRGFNQSELLASQLGERLGLIVLPALVKVKETKSQKELTGKERAENLSGCFECVTKHAAGLRILLVDDVFTTGATANECARVLLRAKAKEVSVLTAAVTKRKPPLEGKPVSDKKSSERKNKADTGA